MTVSEYISSRPPQARKTLKVVRAQLKKALPGAKEVISYQIPALELGGRRIVWFAAWKEHYSLYPVGPRVAAALGGALDGYQISKGTLRLPYGVPVPVKLIARIAKHLAGGAA